MRTHSAIQVLGAVLATGAWAFAPNARASHHRTLLQAVRYGPPSDMPPLNDPPPTASQKQDFRKLLEKIMSVQDPQHIPSLLTKHMDLILALNGQQGVAVVESILDEAREQNNDDDNLVSRLEQAIEMTLSFAEDFVNTASSLDDQNKQLLGKILRAMSNQELPERQREQALDALFTRERANFSAGFLRHLQGECDKIIRARGMNPDAARTLEMLRVIQTRVLEEVGQDLGEGAQVLGQLIGYENDAERIAVLEAGLSVRGLEFAVELQELTTEALDGLARVPGQGADPNLVRVVQGIDAAIQRYREKEASFQ